jgi:GTP diphosphokinase / guanosine-3',5'-bis(diphosphate) 3'-diphosphatase
MSQPQPAQDKRILNSVNRILSAMKTYGADDLALVRKTFDFALSAHSTHFRNSGEPYIHHLLETAVILAELGSSGKTISAGLLHDAVEDVGVKIEDIEKEFGKEVAFMVEGVTKLGKLKYQGTDRHNESLRKLFLAMSEDIRVLIIKLADRLHNMRTLMYVPQEKQRRIAAETLEIYAPIAYRLGIRKLSRELEDLAFPYVYPKEYDEIKKKLKENIEERTESLEKFSRSVKKSLAKEGFTKISTEHRVKGLFSLYKKLLRDERDLEKIYDINAMRVLCDTVADCYRILGIIHSKWRPLPGRIKDYIAFPKPNGYQAIHTTVFVGDGSVVEVQIKTREMYKHSEYGIASHLSYKSKEKDKEVLAWVHSLLPRTRSVTNPASAEAPKWIKELAEYEEPSKDRKLYRERLSSDFFSHRIFAFSPKGDVIDLPLDSTPIDFAYSIHSDIGNTMTGAKVNSKLVSLDTKLKNGDIVEIMTKDNAKPNRKWLEIAKTSMARRHIRHRLGLSREK